MVSVVQRLEHWIVVPVVGGSSPLAHPMYFSPLNAAIGCSWLGVGKKEVNFAKPQSQNPNIFI